MTELKPEDWEATAKQLLPQAVYDYYAGGAEDERTLRANRAAYERVGFAPRVLVDVSGVDTSTTLLGTRLAHPILVAPTAFQRLAHAGGESAAGRAAARTSTLYVASTLATEPIEDIGAAAGLWWLQVYVFRDRGLTKSLVERAAAAGAKALALTVTVPVQGLRERDARNAFTLPPGVELANFRGRTQAAFPGTEESGLAAYIARDFDPSLTWDAVEWLASVSGLPVLVKGVMTPEDARVAVSSGASGVIVSNHGGRQLDGALPTLVALPSIVDAVAGAVPVLVDGGIRRGSDVAKAIASGADAALLGRGVLWSLAAGGEEGVVAYLEQVRSGLVRTMALLGRPTLADLDASALVPLP